MILADDNPTVIKRYENPNYAGGAQVEASGVDPQRFWLCIGGDDYYASEESLNAAQATVLRDMLTAWLSRP